MCELDGLEDLDGLDDGALAALVLGLEAEAERLEARRLRAVAVWEARAGWAADGAPDGVSWLAARLGQPRAAVAALVRDGRRLATMPATGAALAAGSLAPAKARLLCRAVNRRTRDAFARDEEMLIDLLRPLNYDQAAQAVRFWLHAADPDGTDPASPDTNSVYLSKGFQGRWTFKGNLDPHAGTVVAAMLDSLAEQFRRERRAGGEDLAGAGPRLRADALVEMARRASAAGREGTPAANLIWVIAGENQLSDGAGLAELDEAGTGLGPISAVLARRLACDADIDRVLLAGPDGNPVALNRAQRRATAAQRRALYLRDKGCAFPGCGRPPGWCEAHHLVFWANGGLTTLANLCLLCAYHHHLCHEGGYTATRHPDGQLAFHRPDGTRIQPPTIAA